MKKKTFIQLLARLRCTVPTPGWEKRRVLLSDLKSRQPTTWEVDHQTAFHLQVLLLSLSKLQSSRLDANCYECSVRWADWNPRSAALEYFSRFRDPQPEDLVMYLHALRYTVSNVNFKWRQTSTNSPPGQFLDIPNPPPRLGRTRLDLMKTAVCVGNLKFIQMSHVMSC